MIGLPDEYDLDRWASADLAALRDDLDQALQPEAGAPDAPPDRPASDAELIDAVRGGFIQAYGQLYERHVGAARNLARHLARSPAEADDLVSDAFAKVLDTLRAGRGPDSAFRAYLLTALRHTAYDKMRRDKRVKLADDVEAVSDVEKVTTMPFHDPAVATLERSLATRAFASLPERWQTVLWQTEIEGQSAAELAPLLGLTANGASALAYRAREGLKTAYLRAHVAHNPTTRCRATVAKLGAWTRGGLTRRETAQVEAHLDECTGNCRALAAELVDVNDTLRAVIAPLVLGSGAAAYLAASGTAKVSAATAGAASVATNTHLDAEAGSRGSESSWHLRLAPRDPRVRLRSAEPVLAGVPAEIEFGYAVTLNSSSNIGRLISPVAESVRVLLHVEGAAVEPLTQSLRLPVHFDENLVRFRVVPVDQGVLELVFRVYLGDGQLLQEVRTGLLVGGADA